MSAKVLGAGALALVAVGCSSTLKTPLPDGGFPPAVEFCGNATDDDGDGLIDCQDDDCFSDASCVLSCLDLCLSGDKICDTAGLKTCAKDPVSGCFGYGLSTACTGGNVCSGGACVTSCSAVCTAGATQCSASGGVVTCQSFGAGCTDWVGPTACGANEICSGGACVPQGQCVNQCTQGDKRCTTSGYEQTCVKLSTGCTEWSFPASCGSGSSCAAGKPGCQTNSGGCTDGAKRCAANGSAVEQCLSGQWNVSQSCGQGCAAGACTTTTTCAAGAVRCSGNDVQTCNSTGTAWLHQTSCQMGCASGLCTDTCTAGKKRCNGQVPETCNASASWVAGVTCPLGCWLGECIEPDLVVDGTTVTLDGDKRYGNAIVVRDGGTLKVGSSASLTLRAKSIFVEAGSRITGDSVNYATTGGSHYDDDSSAVPGPKYSSYYPGGGAIRLLADTIKIDGDVSSNGYYQQYRGDIVVAADSISGDAGFTGYYVKLLHGASDALAVHASSGYGTFRSAMPPDRLSSTTHPDPTLWYNDGQPTVSVAWSKPFASANGYYWLSTSDSNELPAPGFTSSKYATGEAISFPSSQLYADMNYVHVVTVDSKSTVGTIKTSFPVQINRVPPAAVSPSHNSSTWTNDPAVFMKWTNTVSDASFTGYAYVLDHFMDTIPGPTATFTTNKQTLLAGTPNGLWFFHVVSKDTRGFFTKAASHTMVLVGPEPLKEAVSGTITDSSSGAALDAVTIKVNHGVYQAKTGPSGVYTYVNGLYVGEWVLTAEKAGYTTATKTISLVKGTPAVVDFALVKNL